MYRLRTRGFTLLELLLVVAIIGLLIQILLPAIQSSREAARKTTCKIHIHELATGAQMHLDSFGFFPSGGWSGNYLADPNRGYGREQPGSWQFSLLSFIELSDLRDSGVGESVTATDVGPGLLNLYTSAPSIFYCPSRRSAKPYPPATLETARWKLLVARDVALLARVTKSDYAANSGDAIHNAADGLGTDMWWPAGYDKLISQPQLWTNTSDRGSVFFQTGVSYYRSEIRASQILDGMSHTYLFGEKFMTSETYEDINNALGNDVYGDNQSAWVGYEFDNHRVAWQPKSLSIKEDYQPQRDRPRAFGPAIWAFGSAHPDAINMSFCDGSTRSIAYDVDYQVHRKYANRSDGGSVDR